MSKHFWNTNRGFCVWKQARLAKAFGLARKRNDLEMRVDHHSTLYHGGSNNSKKSLDQLICLEYRFSLFLADLQSI